VTFCRLFRVLAVLAMGLACVAWAQGQNASLHGIVIAPSGSPVPGATIAVEGKGGAQAATTDLNGEYNLGGLAAGAYDVKISAPGYGPFEVQTTLTTSVVGEVDAVLIAIPVKRTEPAPTAPAEVPGAQGQPGEAPAQTPSAQPQTTITTQELSVTAKKGRAALYGLVTDQSGAVVGGGVATLGSPKGPVTANVNARGQYTFEDLAPGTYNLSLSSTGFAPFVTDITLLADQSLEIDAPLQPPSAKTEVNVEAGGPAAVETGASNIEGTITQKEVIKTGLNGRNFTQLIALAPGVSNQTGQDEALVGIKGSVKYSVNGGRVEYNNFDVDGSDVLNAGLNGAESTLMVYPSLDAIQEVKVLTSNYGAMYGRSASGTVLVTTKSGTAKIHGGAYEFLRNEFFNARNYFDQTTKAPLYRRQDFGGTIGGPLFIPGVFNTKKDRTYFFWSEEVRLEKSPVGPGGEPGDFNQAVPTLAERGIGVSGGNCPQSTTQSAPCFADFTDVCPPYTFGVPLNRTAYPDCPANGISQFPNNLVPIDPTSQALLNTGMIPLPNSTTGCNSSLANTINPTTNQPNVPCYDAVISPPTYWREELFRIDHDIIPQKMRASFRYIHDSWNTTAPTPEWGYEQNSFPTAENKLNGPGISMVARLTNTFSSSLLNEFVAGYVDAHITLTSVNGPGANLQPLTNCALDAGLPPCTNSIFENGFGGKPPGLVFAGTNADYGGNGFRVDPSYEPWQHTNPTYSLGDNVSKSLRGGKHTLQFGIQAVDAQRKETNGAIGAATGDLQGVFTFSNQPGQTANYGNAFANFLALPNSQNTTSANGIVSYQQDSAQLTYYNDYWVAEPYVQDDWRANRHVTVNLGVRLSLFGNFHEKNLNAYNWESGAFSPTLASTVQIAEPGQNVSQGWNGGFLTVVGQAVALNPNNPSSNLNPVVTNGLVQCGKNGTPASCMQSHLLNPSPRVGIAWDPKGDGKTSIRGGYGVFFEHGTAKDANTGSLEGSAPNVLTMTQPYPQYYSVVGLNSVAGGQPVSFPLDVTAIPTKTVWPYVQQWSLSIQHQLPKETVATMAYVGSKGTHLPVELQINQLTPPPTGPDNGIFLNGNPFNPGQPIITQVTPGAAGAGDCIFNPGPNTFTGSNGTGINGHVVTQAEPAWQNMAAACFGSGGVPSPNSLRPYLGFQRILSLQDVADSQYHALQATIRRSHGPLTLGASYTYSHSLDDSSDRSDAIVNSANLTSNWSSSDFDQRHLLNFNYIYDLPKFGQGLRRALSFEDSGDGVSGGGKPSGDGSDFWHIAFDGWQVSGITLFSSGTPFSVRNGGNTSLGISRLDNAGVASSGAVASPTGIYSYPDVVADPRAALPDGINRFNPQSVGPLLYNPAAFAAPTALTFGNAGRNFLNNPHRINFDMSLLKNFKVSEGSNLEFRLEGFNIFNHTQFRIFNSNIGNTAENTVSCYAGALSNFSAAGGYIASSTGQPVPVDCTTGSSFLHPVDAHRPRTLQLGLKYSF
jgi:hypothetical protein